jgi:DNA primase large subunit
LTATVTDREAERRALAEKAVHNAEAQAAIKKVMERLRAHEAKEKARALAAQAEARAISKELDKVRSQATAAASAVESLRQKFVPLEVRHALSAAARGEREALAVVTRTASDLSKARESLDRVKHRVKTVPSHAPAGDLLELVKREEDALASHEAAASFALEALERAKVEHATARAAHDAAMAAALAL